MKTQQTWRNLVVARRLHAALVLGVMVIGISGAVLASERGNPDSNPLSRLSDYLRAGMSEDCLLVVVRATHEQFHAADEDMNNLRSLGASENVINEIVLHDRGIEATIGTPAPPVPELESPPASQSQAVVETAPASYEPRPFQEELQGYGHWVCADGEYYWQPEIAQTEPAWQPYCQNGEWVYTDWGWTWHSAEPWGSVVFHYGRWRRHEQYGWIWWPDTVWAPAWVTFRSGPIHCGWAPLPPHTMWEDGAGISFHGSVVSGGYDFGLTYREYCFVPTAEFCGADIAHRRVPHTRVVNFYNQTTSVRNTYIAKESAVVINNVQVSAIEKASNRRVSQVTLFDVKGTDRKGMRSERLSGGNLMMYRPKPGNFMRPPPAMSVSHLTEPTQPQFQSPGLSGRSSTYGFAAARRDIATTRTTAGRGSAALASATRGRAPARSAASSEPGTAKAATAAVSGGAGSAAGSGTPTKAGTGGSSTASRAWTDPRSRSPAPAGD